MKLPRLTLPKHGSPPAGWCLGARSARSLSEKFRSEHPEVPWKKIIGMRNLITHAYGEVDYVQV